MFKHRRDLCFASAECVNRELSESKCTHIDTIHSRRVTGQQPQRIESRWRNDRDGRAAGAELAAGPGDWGGSTSMIDRFSAVLRRGKGRSSVGGGAIISKKSAVATGVQTTRALPAVEVLRLSGSAHRQRLVSSCSAGGRRRRRPMPCRRPAQQDAERPHGPLPRPGSGPQNIIKTTLRGRSSFPKEHRLRALTVNFLRSVGPPSSQQTAPS